MNFRKILNLKKLEFKKSKRYTKSVTQINSISLIFLRVKSVGQMIKQPTGDHTGDMVVEIKLITCPWGLRA